jgi:uncharacterized membrane protein
MRKDKILLIFGFILVISWIAGVILSDNWVSFRILLNIWIVIIINWFILKYKLDSGKVYIDERILKISYKSIALSWFTTLILTGFLIVLMQFKIVTSLTSFQAVSLIFTTMTITYIFSLFSYRNKKI